MMIPMAPETESLVQEHLRHIRGAVDALREDNREIKTGLASSNIVEQDRPH
jgi:hypothetical protein